MDPNFNTEIKLYPFLENIIEKQRDDKPLTMLEIVIDSCLKTFSSAYAARSAFILEGKVSVLSDEEYTNAERITEAASIGDDEDDQSSFFNLTDDEEEEEDVSFIESLNLEVPQGSDSANVAEHEEGQNLTREIFLQNNTPYPIEISNKDGKRFLIIEGSEVFLKDAPYGTLNGKEDKIVIELLLKEIVLIISYRPDLKIKRWTIKRSSKMKGKLIALPEGQSDKGLRPR